MRLTWLIRFWLFAPARQLFRECAADTLAEHGADAAVRLRAEIDPGTPLSGRLLIWLMVNEIRRQARLDQGITLH